MGRVRTWMIVAITGGSLAAVPAAAITTRRLRLKGGVVGQITTRLGSKNTTVSVLRSVRKIASLLIGPSDCAAPTKGVVDAV
jgi:hypothetical protein